jgi:hypothetical protein
VIGIELYFDDVERAASDGPGAWPTVVTPPGLGLGASVKGTLIMNGSSTSGPFIGLA